MIKDSHVLVVKNTYEATKGKYLIPGDFSEDNGMEKMKKQYL